MKITKDMREIARRLGKLGGRPKVKSICPKCGRLVSARQRRMRCTEKNHK